MYNLYKIANGDESLIFFISAESLEIAENVARNTLIEDHDIDEEDLENEWENFSSHEIVLNFRGIVETFNSNDIF